MTQSIAQKFTPWSLIRFALPSIIMMGFMSLYTITDGIFVSRFSGSDALSAINIVYPLFNILLAIGIMFATGGSAVVARQLGAGKEKEARESFTGIVAVSLAASLVLLLVTLLFTDPLCRFLGADDSLMPDCRAYLCTLMIFAPACMLQSLYQSFFVTAGSPNLGLLITTLAGIANAVLDYVFMAVFGWGIAGAAAATGIGQMIPAVFGTFFFFNKKKTLSFTRFRINSKILLQACGNGSSEMVTNLSNAVITFAFNLILMEMAGSDGVAAITIILYGQFLFSSLYLGFSLGVAPIFSYRFGAKDMEELRKLYGTCSRFVWISSLIVAGASFMGTPVVVGAFVSRQSNTYSLASEGFRIFSAAYLFSGFSIFSSALFTALSDGKNSALISFARTFGFILIALATLPELVGIPGVWAAVPLAEFASVFLAGWLSRKKLPMFRGK